jgi:hypothetical protein
MSRIASALLLCAMGLWGQEAQRIEQTLESLQKVKAQLAELQSEVDGLILKLNEQKGAANAAPAAALFGGSPAAASIEPDKPAPQARCAALTKDGTRCTRAAQQGKRYCKQHAYSKSK